MTCDMKKSILPDRIGFLLIRIRIVDIRIRIEKSQPSVVQYMLKC